MIPRELFPERFDERIVEFSVPPIVKEIPEVVSSSHDAAHAVPAPVHECVAPARNVAHATPAPEVDVAMHNQVGQEQFPTTLNPVEIPIELHLDQQRPSDRERDSGSARSLHVQHQFQFSSMWRLHL